MMRSSIGWLGVVAVVALGALGCGGGGGGGATDGPGGDVGINKDTASLDGAGGDLATGKDAAADTVGADLSGGDRADDTALDTSGDGATAVTLIATPSTLKVLERDDHGTTFTLGLDHPSATTVVAHLASANPTVAGVVPDTVTFDPGQTGPVTVTVMAVPDVDTVDGKTDIVISSPDANGATVKVEVTDQDQQRVVVSPTQLTVLSGHDDSFGVTLAYRPAGPVTVAVTSGNTASVGVNPAQLTFTAENYDKPQTVTVHGVQAPTGTDAHVDVTLDPGAVAQKVIVGVVIPDVGVPQIDASKSSVTVTEGDATAATVDVALTIAASAVLKVTSSDPSHATVSPATLTFTPDNFSTKQTISIVSVHDDDTQDDTVNVTITADGLPSRIIAVAVKDIDKQALVIAPGQLMIDEGGSGTFTVKLAHKPGMATAVNLLPSNSAKISLTPSTLNFDPGNYSTTQTVTVQGLVDDDAANESVHVSLTALGIDTGDLTVDVKDKDVQKIVVTYPGAPGDLVLQEGAAGQGVDVRLATRPPGPVVVNVSGGGSKLTVAGGPLMFTPNDFGIKKLTLSAAHDGDLADEHYDLTLTATGIPSAPLPVQVNDVDVESFTVSTSSLKIDEPASGATGQAEFTVGLSLPPPSAVAVTVTSSDSTRVALQSGSDSFSLSNTTAATVKLTIKHDVDAMDDTVTLTIHAGGEIADRTVSVQIHDKDTMKFAVTLVGPVDPAAATRLVLSEGAPPKMAGDKTSATFTVALAAAPPAGSTTVTLAPSMSGVVGVSPPTLMFTGGAAGTWQTPQTVTVSGIKDSNLADEFLTINVSGDVALGAPPVTVSVHQRDMDTQEILLFTKDNSNAFVAFDDTQTITADEGGASQTFYASLKWQPAASTVVTVTSPAGVSASLKASPTTLTFTPGNYNLPQPINVMAPEEDPSTMNLDNETGDVTLAIGGQATRTVHLASRDNDVQSVVLTELNCSVPCVQITALMLTESQKTGMTPAHKLNVALAYPPKQPAGTTQDISVLYNSGKIAVSPLMFTFDNSSGVTDQSWNVPQTLTLAAVADADANNESATMTVGPPSTAFPRVSVQITVTDLD